jgi:2-dehydro-3-deoxyphosphogluconate aldolase / (4S)-4-hydroxy-2-oxoglutarate aldolase
LTEGTLRLIEQGRVIAILRGDFGGREADIVEVLVEAGIRAVEVTLNSPGAFKSIEKLANLFRIKTAIGAGTVLEPDDVVVAANAGAKFIVSPNLNVKVIDATRRLNLVSLPGCFTPSEIIAAFDAGAHAVKLFPASCLGTSFLKAMRGPLREARLVPVGGVTPLAAREFFDAGAWAIGAGSELIGKEITAPGGLEMLRARAAEFVAAAERKDEG